ncbi:MAG: GNAT family N-acetyltransferase [Actinobacteria bacterium]|uniref:N-acetyltransferase domain-containing protein n=1 Tax=Nostocoides veronense TaxID=330836 RepID=A0ABN2LG76_9MICO|nr:GNAT family N-acetyltransferase [Actinomycetota bacterium]
MARPHVTVSKASAQDAGTLSALWIESALSLGQLTQDAAARLANAGRVEDAVHRPGTSVLLAWLDGMPVGFAVVNVRHHGLIDAPALAIDELYVRLEARRQGVAGHLLAGVARLAESQGQELVFAQVSATDKISNRYFARLGFATTTTRRVVPTAVLRRKLAGADTASRDVLLGKRRTLRARAGLGAPAGPVRSLPMRRAAAG